jgi:hypothetical protein
MHGADALERSEADVHHGLVIGVQHVRNKYTLGTPCLSLMKNRRSDREDVMVGAMQYDLTVISPAQAHVARTRSTLSCCTRDDSSSTKHSIVFTHHDAILVYLTCNLSFLPCWESACSYPHSLAAIYAVMSRAAGLDSACLGGRAERLTALSNGRKYVCM